MAYVVLSRNGEESFNKFSSPDPEPDPDHLRSHGDNTYAPEQTYKHIDKQTQMHYPRTPLQERG